MWIVSSKVIVIYFLSFCALKTTASIENVQNTFGSNLCIRGSLSTIVANEKEIFVMQESGTDTTVVSLNNNSLIQNKYNIEKNALSKLNELAQFNEIDYFYKLIKEEGPSHNKLFTVSLTLGDEEYMGQGSSLKKAQQNAATVALEKTEYAPAVINEKEVNDDAVTPTVLLNNLCMKLGIGVEYFLVNKDAINSNNIGIDKSKKSYLEKLNESLYSDIHIRKDETQNKGPFKVAVQVGDLSFYGTSHTIQLARHEAASKAIDHLIKEIREGNSVCLKEGFEDECTQAKANLKSPISLVHEAAQLRNLNVEFEIIEESGPSHKKVFVTKCTLGHLSTTGEGKSKKESKKVAAINMLDRIPELPEVSQEKQVKNIVAGKKKKKNKKNKILKTNFDVINMHVIDNLIGTVKDYALPFQNDQNSAQKSAKSGQSKHSKKSFQDGMLELGNTLKFEVQFMDFQEKGKFYTIMSLQLNPEYICLGDGSSTKMARNKAAKGGLQLLQNIDFGSLFKDTKLTLIESEIKQRVNILLNKGVYEEQKES